MLISIAYMIVDILFIKRGVHDRGVPDSLIFYSFTFINFFTYFFVGYGLPGVANC